MATYILHLSDLHIKEKEKINYKKCSQMLERINLKKNDNICIVISGDITDTGEINQYEIYKTFQKKLLEIIKNKITSYCPIYVVPGNHDLLSKERINRMPSKKQTEEQFNIELTKFNNFYTSFNKLYVKNKYLDIQTFRLQDETCIDFYLINSAAFSSIDDENQDNDIGTHNLPESVINKLRNVDEDKFNILVSHYPLNYFSDEQRYELEEIVSEKFKICFFGHEHTNKVMTNCTTNNNVIYISGRKYDDGICLVRISDKKENIIISNYVYTNFNGGMFRKFEGDKNFKIIKSDARLKEKFYNDVLFYDENSSSKIDLDDFVFLPLDKIKEGKRTIINDIDDLMNEIIAKDIILFEGKKLYGKTLLAKKIFYELFNKGLYGIYLDCKKFHKIDFKKDINQIIIDTYTDGLEFAIKLEQEEKRKKYIIIDNAELIKNYKKIDIINTLMQEYGKIILLYSDKDIFNLDDELSNFLNVKNDSLVEFNLKKCNHLARVKLIERKYKEKGIDKSKHSIEKLSKKLITMQYLIELNPYYINLLVDSTINRPDNLNLLLGSMIETNINNNLYNHCDPQYIEPYKEILAKIAYYIFDNKKIEITEQELIDIVKSYQGITTKFSSFLRTIVNAGILNDKNGYSFNKEIELSFFLSKWIIMNSDKNSEFYKETNSLVDYLLDNIIYGINSNVLLLVAFYKYDNSLLEKIIVNVECEFENISNNIFELPYFKNKEISISEKKIGVNSFENVEEPENEVVDSIKIKNIFDKIKYSKEEALILKGIKYIEIISKIIYNYSFRLGKTMSERVVSNLFELPNKLIYSYVKIMCNKIGDNIMLFEQNIKKTNTYNLLEIKGIVKEFINLLTISFIDTTYLNVASNAINDINIDSFMSYDTENIDYWITKLQKQYFYCENENFEKALKITEEIERDCKNRYIKFFSKYNIMRLYNFSFSGQIAMLEKIEKIYPGVSKKIKQKISA